MESVYKVKLEAFEGPMDLLLHLIEEERVNIYDIPIAKITKQYLEYIEVLESLNLAALGDFMVMLATLLEIKSKLLLPKPESEDGNKELEEGEDPREELARRLLEYQKYKASIRELRERESTFLEIFGPRRPFDKEYNILQEIFDFQGRDKLPLDEEGDGELDEDSNEAASDGMWLEEASIFDLLSAFRQVLKRGKNNALPEIVDQDVPIGQRIDYIIDQLERKGKIEFLTLLGFFNRVVDFVGMFLALLELIRLKRVKVKQSQIFGRIYILKTSHDNPPGDSEGMPKGIVSGTGNS